MTNTRKINVPKIPPAEYWETHNKPGTKGVKVSILEDTKPENPEPEAEIIVSDATIRSRSKAKPGNDLNRRFVCTKRFNKSSIYAWCNE